MKGRAELYSRFHDTIRLVELLFSATSLFVMSLVLDSEKCEFIIETPLVSAADPLLPPPTKSFQITHLLRGNARTKKGTK